jgi:hypothetical protein
MDAASGGLAITSCPGRSQWSEGCRRRRWNELAMKDDELRRDVTAELSWDPQVDSDAVAAAWSALGVTQVEDRIRVESRP